MAHNEHSIPAQIRVCQAQKGVNIQVGHERLSKNNHFLMSLVLFHDSIIDKYIQHSQAMANR
jgi:hypothetical protein